MVVCDSVGNSQQFMVLYIILHLILCFSFAAMDYLSYEQTLPHVTATYFNSFKFYKKQDILTLIHAIPEELYGSLPAGVTEKKDPAVVESSNGTKLSPS